MPRRISAGLLAGVLVLGLAGCSQDEEGSAAGPLPHVKMPAWFESLPHLKMPA